MLCEDEGTNSIELINVNVVSTNRIVGIITSGQYLQGVYHPHGSSFCDAFGLLLVAVLWTGEFDFIGAFPGALPVL